MLDRPAPMHPMPSRNPLRAGVGRFLAQSHHRVIEHCQALLSAGELAETDRRRLIRVMRAAESELSYLDRAA
ncbi:MAG TPA: hypothetical protein VMW18_10340 [Candidatus Binatia bacterium]|nr:hypothetical protein [Candidatus Binatia bacterium]